MDVINSFELIIQDNNTIFKTIPTIFHRYAWTCYYSLGPVPSQASLTYVVSLLHVLA